MEIDYGNLMSFTKNNNKNKNNKNPKNNSKKINIIIISYNNILKIIVKK